MSPQSQRSPALIEPKARQGKAGHGAVGALLSCLLCQLRGHLQLSILVLGICSRATIQLPALLIPGISLGLCSTWMPQTCLQRKAWLLWDREQE